MFRENRGEQHGKPEKNHEYKISLESPECRQILFCIKIIFYAIVLSNITYDSIYIKHIYIKQSPRSISIKI